MCFTLIRNYYYFISKRYFGDRISVRAFGSKSISAVFLEVTVGTFDVLSSPQGDWKRAENPNLFALRSLTPFLRRFDRSVWKKKNGGSNEHVRVTLGNSIAIPPRHRDGRGFRSRVYQRISGVRSSSDAFIGFIFLRWTTNFSSATICLRD